MWQSPGAVDNKRGWKAQSRTGIERQFVATSPSQEHSEAAAESRQAARTRVFERQLLHIESLVEP